MEYHPARGKVRRLSQTRLLQLRDKAEPAKRGRQASAPLDEPAEAVRMPTNRGRSPTTSTSTVNPATVQPSDLVLGGMAAATAARFTVNGIFTELTLTANIAADAGGAAGRVARVHPADVEAG